MTSKSRSQLPAWPSWAILAFIVVSYVIGRLLSVPLGDIWGWLVALPVALGVIYLTGRLWLAIRKRP